MAFMGSSNLIFIWLDIGIPHIHDSGPGVRTFFRCKQDPAITPAANPAKAPNTILPMLIFSFFFKTSPNRIGQLGDGDRKEIYSVI
jgi:hypothetical protein